MNDREKLEQLSATLQHLHRRVLQAERDIVGAPGGLTLLDKLVNDPQWAAADRPGACQHPW